MAEKKLSKPLAWIGTLTAIFSVVGGAYGGWTFFSGQYEKRRAISGLLAAEAVQLSTQDYAAAWKTLEQASAIDSNSEKVLQAQEDVAMQWLENVHATEDNTFTQISEKLGPVLTRGANSAKSPQRQADLLAHLGYSYFLRLRESPSGPDPESAYREALQKDPTNPYAHAMWGHWILWNDQGLAKGNEHFAAALASPRNLRPYVRTLQVAAVLNGHGYDYDEEAVRVANGIRKEQGDLDAHSRGSILFIYSVRMIPPGASTPAFLAAVPPAEHLATFEWIAQNTTDRVLMRGYCRSRLLEAAGRNDEALAAYRELEKQFKDASYSIVNPTQQAIARLTGKK
ncbi:MAG: hypothetical protein LAO55_17895 [Acidobacteriia bacterium]|nr:hypothetical protein [Terriglobia bacterium]